MKNFKKLFSILVMVLSFCFITNVSALDSLRINKRDMNAYIGQTKFSYKTNASDGSVVYCYNGVKFKAPTNDMTLYSNSALDDIVNKNYPGLVSILNSGYPNNNLGLSSDEAYYVTQISMWWYIDRVDGFADTQSGLLTANFKSKHVVNSKYYNIATNLLNGALNYDATKNSKPSITVTGNSSMKEITNSDNSISLISKNSYSINTNGTVSNKYTVSLSDNSFGAYITDETGHENYGKSVTLDASKGFKIVIPNITRGNSYSVDANVTINGSYSNVKLFTPSGTYAGSYQSIYYLSVDKLKLNASVTAKGKSEIKQALVKFAKADENGNFIGGATLKIVEYTVSSDGTKNDKSIVASWKSEDGKAKTLNLDEGNYYFAEVFPPSGYKKSYDKVYFSVDENGKLKDDKNTIITNADNTFIIVNKRATFPINKVDENGKNISGATLKVCAVASKLLNGEDACFTFVTTDKPYVFDFTINGKKLYKDMFEVSEVSAPDGYVKSEQVIKFGLDKNGDTYIFGGANVSSIKFRNTNETNLKITKTDMTGTNEVEGAKLKLTDSLGNVVDEWISSKTNHEVFGLVIGNVYTLEEVYAPKGYVVTTSLKFKVVGDGKAILVDDNGNILGNELDEVKIKNDTTKLKISKIDITNGKELEGATLQILDMDNNPISDSKGNLLKWVSTNEAHYIEMLPVGSYKLVEVISPEGYVAVTNEVIFEVKSTSEIQSVVFKNDVTKLLISKRDFTTDEELTGAHIQIIDSTGKVVEEWDSTNEPHYIEKLPVGDYTLVETIYPSGYAENMIIDGVVTTEYKFSITDNSLMKINVYNKVMDVPNTLDSSTTIKIFGGLFFMVGCSTIVIVKKKYNY